MAELYTLRIKEMELRFFDFSFMGYAVRKKMGGTLLAALFLALFFQVPEVAAKSGVSAGKMKDFKIVVPGVLSRSGLPSGKDLLSLKNRGWKSAVVLISSGEMAAYGKIDPFSTLEFRQSGLKKISIIIPEGQPPTNAQALQFLAAVRNSKNQPVHVFCRKGHARTGTLVALYRYSVQGWTMKKAIREAKRYGSGISSKQRGWLQEWARAHPQ